MNIFLKEINLMYDCEEQAKYHGYTPHEAKQDAIDDMVEYLVEHDHLSEEEALEIANERI